MDGEQQKFQFLGFFGISKEAFNIITSHRKIFSQITLSVILPLSFIYLAQKEFSEFWFGKITPDKNVSGDAQMGSQNYSNPSDMFSSEWTSVSLYRIAFFIFSIIFFLFSTSAVVYTIACIYSEKEITYKKVVKVVPKVWKRLVITFLWNIVITSGIIMGASLLAGVLVVLWVVTFGQSATAAGIAVAIILVIIIVVGITYLSFVWQLANVISVLEDVYGIQAMVKSKKLIKGNIGVCIAFFLTYNICFLGIDQGFKASDGLGVDSVWGKLLHLCLWSVVMSMLSLFGLVTQTIIYFICKSYHHENIDKSSLADHLEMYGNDYVRLDTKELLHMQHSMV